MRILILDESADFRTQCAEHIARHWPGAQVEMRAPTAAPHVPEERGWTHYDALLIDHRDGQHNAIEWLRAFQDRISTMPPAILLSAESGEEIAVQAMKLGAADYLRKDKVTPSRLIAAINDAILEHARERDRQLARNRTAERFATTTTVALDVESIGVLPTEDAPRINGYKILRQIGEGGTSRVYLAERLPRLGQLAPDPRQVVLKVLSARFMNQPEFIDRFIREYRVISNVQNEHVARIYDQGVTDDHLYIAMEYFAFGDLKKRMDHKDAGRLSSMQALRLMVQIAKALDAIHSAGVTHRDLKPHNIMFRDAERLALVDFGLAKLSGEASITATGSGLLATPLYMSPEQCLGRTPDARSDLYSAGVILYELLTSKRLFDSDSLAAIAFQHVHADVPRLPEAIAGYQPLLDRLLAKNPDDRFQSARELFSYIAY